MPSVVLHTSRSFNSALYSGSYIVRKEERKASALYMNHYTMPS